MQLVAQHDELTGLMNRSGLEAWLAGQQARMRANPSGLLVLIGDLDGFKQVNDTLGHAAGDLVLQEVARRLQAAVRAADAVARLGGDEFVLVLHAPLGLADRQATETAHRVWSKVTEPYHVGDVLVTIGLSLGGAGWPEDDGQIVQRPAQGGRGALRCEACRQGPDHVPPGADPALTGALVPLLRPRLRVGGARRAGLAQW